MPCSIYPVSSFMLSECVAVAEPVAVLRATHAAVEQLYGEVIVDHMVCSGRLNRTIHLLYRLAYMTQG